MQSPRLHCNLDTPFKAWSLHILQECGNRCLCKCHIIRVQTEERCDQFQVLGKPGRFSLIFSLKGKSFRPIVVSALGRFGSISKGTLENGGVWYQDRVGLWHGRVW